MADGTLTPEQNQQLGSLLSQIQAKADAQNEGAMGMTGGSVCAVYKEVKPLIDDVLPLLKHLPHGDQIVSAIQMLEKVADGLCPQSDA